jgi:hypothetical protein
MGNAVSPQAKENERRLSREYKRRLKGTCRICGAETRYAGRPGKPVSDLCHEHAMQAWGEARKGQGELQQRVLHYLYKPRRYSEIREACGISDNAMSPTLQRLMEHGLIERVSRGVYARVN